MDPQPEAQARMELQDIATYAVIVVVIAVVLAFGQKILTDVGTPLQCDTGYTFNSSSNGCYLTANGSITNGTTLQYNSTVQGKAGLGKFSDYLPTVAIVLIAGFLITVLYKVFLGQNN